jgi:hypothetical protein
MVNARFPPPARYGFETMDAASAPFAALTSVKAGINRKFTPNQINRDLRKISAILPQCKHLRFIDGC